MYPNEKVILQPKKQQLEKVEALFKEEFSGLVTKKIINKFAQAKFMAKVQFNGNVAVLDIKMFAYTLLYSQLKKNIKV